jgi:predicted AAA+ superfamily ATPase
VTDPLPEVLHRKLLDYLKRFLVLGGMPEVMAEYARHRDTLACQSILDDLLISLKADFVKYKKRVPGSRLTEVFEAAARQTGNKFVYSKTSGESNHKQVKEALELLIMAGLLIPVTHSSGNGIPLGAERNGKKRKMLIFDTGIFQRALGLEISEVLFQQDFNLVNKGFIAELFAGLEFVKSSSGFRQQELFYWQREALNSNAEVDYLIQLKEEIVPVEVKSGTKGSMQSMFLFLDEKKRPFGFRLSLENYSAYGKVLVYPLYSAGELLHHFDLRLDELRF